MATNQLGKLPDGGIAADDAQERALLLVRRDGFEGQLAFADPNGGSQRNLRLHHSKVADEGPIGGSVIEDAIDAVLAGNSQVFAGDEAVGQHQVVARIGPDVDLVAHPFVDRLIDALAHPNLGGLPAGPGDFFLQPLGPRSDHLGGKLIQSGDAFAVHRPPLPESDIHSVGQDDLLARDSRDFGSPSREIAEDGFTSFQRYRDLVARDFRIGDDHIAAIAPAQDRAGSIQGEPQDFFTSAKEHQLRHGTPPERAYCKSLARIEGRSGEEPGDFRDPESGILFVRGEHRKTAPDDSHPFHEIWIGFELQIDVWLRVI